MDSVMCFLWIRKRLLNMLPIIPYGSADCQGQRCKPFGPPKQLCVLATSFLFIAFKVHKCAVEVWSESSSLTLGCYLLFADDTVLLAATNCDHSCALEQFVG